VENLTRKKEEKKKKKKGHYLWLAQHMPCRSSVRPPQTRTTVRVRDAGSRYFRMALRRKPRKQLAGFSICSKRRDLLNEAHATGPATFPPATGSGSVCTVATGAGAARKRSERLIKETKAGCCPMARPASVRSIRHQRSFLEKPP